MPVGTRTPPLAGRALRLTAVAAATACWLAVPAVASAQQDPAVGVSGLTDAATSAITATGSAVEDTVAAAAPIAGPAQDAVTQTVGTVTQVTGPEGPVARAANATESVVEQVTRPAAPVAGAADRVVSRARGALDEAVGGVDETLRGAAGVRGTLRGADEALDGAVGATRRAVPDGGQAAGQGSPRAGRLPDVGAGSETARSAQLTLRGTAATDRLDAPLPGKPVAPILTPLIPGPPIGLPGAPAGGGDTGSASAGSGLLQLPAGPEPVSGAAGGSSAAGASVSFFLGGLALLLATLSLAGPALRRRLPRRPVIAWPAAFVPLLERPG